MSRMGSSLSVIMFPPSLLDSFWSFPSAIGGPGPALFSPTPLLSFSADRFQEVLDPGNCTYFCQAQFLYTETELTENGSISIYRYISIYPSIYFHRYIYKQPFQTGNEGRMIFLNPFAHCGNRSLSFVHLLTKKQTKVIYLKTDFSNLPISAIMSF